MKNTDKEAVMDSRKAASVQWQKVPSVTGPKPYFYNTITDKYEDKRTVVWDFFCKCWVIKGPQTLEHPYGKPYMTCDSVREAMQYVAAGRAI